MKTRFKTIVMLAMAISSGAHASFFSRSVFGAANRSEVTALAEKKTLAKLDITKSEALAYTDFSGSWRGTCTDTKGTHDSSVEIKQVGSQYLSFDKDEYEVGALKSKVVSGTMSSADIFSLSWSPDQKSLNFKMVYMLAELHHASLLVSGQGEIVRAGNQLTVSAEAAGQKTNCIYQKQ